MSDTTIRANDWNFNSLHNHPDNPRIELDFYDGEGSSVTVILTRHVAGKMLESLEATCSVFDDCLAQKVTEHES